jgi:transcriptional regulator with XRE-family HTH domain
VNIANILKGLREEMGFGRDQRGFATKIGLSLRTLSRWETGEGEPKPYQWHRIVRICRETHPEAVDSLIPAVEVVDNDNSEEDQEGMLKQLIQAQQKIIELQEENKELRELLSKTPTRPRKKKNGNGA